MRNFYYSIIGVLLSLNCLGQPSADFKILKEKYPLEGAVYTNITQRLNIEYENKALKITSSNSRERILLDNRAGLFSESSVDYGDFSKLISIEASTQVAEKGSFKEIKVKEFKTTDRLSTSSVFYDGSKNVSFFYPSLAEGAKTKLNYVQEISHPQLIPGFYFEHHVPVLKAIYTISAPSDVELGWKIFNMPDSLINFSKVVKKNKTTYTWEVQNIKSYRDEEFAPNYLYSMGHMVVWINSYMLDGKKTSLLGTTENLYEWYYNLSKNCNVDDSDDLRSLVDLLTKNVPSEIEKVRNIYYWVQDHIKYIAFEKGMEGFVPRSGRLVFERRYGDCKDMASILTKMMSYAGIPSYLTWIGSRDIPYKYADVPSPQVDNHMIATYINGNNYYFLDATTNNLPLGVSNSFIQGKEALIGIDKNKVEVKVVPVMPMEANRKVDSVFIELDGSKISGKGRALFEGYNKMYLAQSLKDHRSENSKILKSELNKGSNKFQLNSFEVVNLDERDTPLSVKYEFVLEDYLKTIGDELFLNLNLNRDYFFEEIKSNRTFDIEKDYKETRINFIKVKIPIGYTVSELPTPVSFKDDRFGFESKYRIDNGFLILEQKIYYNFMFLQKDEFADWNKYFKSLKKSYSDLIMLKKLPAASAK